MTNRTRILLSGIAAALAIPVQAAPPTFPAHPDGTDTPFNVPCGKTLVIPIAVDDPDGDTVSLSATSSHGRVNVRVRSGNLHYKMRVETADDGSVEGTPTPFAGDMEFQLFRAATPDTAALIGGLAQSGYYDNVLIHRVIPDFVIQGGDKAGTGSGASPFSIRHEFRPELIYSGRGQLAMANSQGGYDQEFPSNGNFRYRTGSFTPTNGSQFFVTLGQPRHLDFKHTLFGQLIRGFDTLDRVETVKTKVADPGKDKPLTDVKMTTHSVKASRTDAVLLLSATNTGPATITVTATDSNGEKSTRTIPVNSVVDTTNDPPLLLPFEPAVTPVGSIPGFAIRSFDLEHDAISTRMPVQDIFSSSNIIYAGVSGGTLAAVSRPDAGAWDITIGVSGLNDPLLDIDPFSASRFQTLEVGVGDKAIVATPRTIETTAATASGDRILASFRHGSAGASPDDFIVSVNWGDGAPIDTNQGATPPVTLVRSSAEPGAFDVVASHTYARVGVYPLHVTIDGPLGATSTMRGWSVVNAADAILRAVGEEVVSRGANFTGKPVAYFTDATPNAKPTDYSVTIDWGDGNRKPGAVRQVAPGRFAVVGTHRYTDAETYSVVSHIERSGPDATAVAWGQVSVTGFSGPEYLPPFSKASITSLWSENPTKVYRGNATDVHATLFLLNGGDKPTGKWKLRFWLSANNTLEPGTDTQLKLGPLNKQVKQLTLNSLPPGAGGNLALKPFAGGDFSLRLPAQETGAGKYVLAQLDYSDPLTDKMPVPKVIPFGPLMGIIVTRVSSPFTLKEDGSNGQGTVTFKVRLDTQPTADVEIPLDVAINGSPNTSRATLSTNSLVFTPQNGTTDQLVTVTVVDDHLQNSQSSVQVRIKAATSTDARFNNMDVADLAVSITDFPRNVVVSPLSLTVREAAATPGTFKVKLQTLPTADVVVPLEIVDADGNPNTTRATLDKSELTFTSANGTTEQTVTVTAVDDTIVNPTEGGSGNASFTIRVKPAVSSDSSASTYNGRNGPDIALTVQDNDAHGITVSPLTIGLAEGGDSMTFSVKLNTTPGSEVTIPLDIVTEANVEDNSRATLSVPQLVFTPENATTPQIVTVTAIDDAIVNGNVILRIRLKPAIAVDGDTTTYHNRDAADVTLTVQDNDTP